MNNIVVAWGKKVESDFLEGVVKLCFSLGWGPEHASWLMACMAFESGETFSPSIKNAAGSGATGLIQFMPATAKDLGTTIENLELLSATAQLYYVGLYFRRYASRVQSLSDMYMAILLPKYVGKPEDSVLFSSGVAYRQNSGLDSNNDGKITKLEATRLVQAKLDKGLTPRYAGVCDFE